MYPFFLELDKTSWGEISRGEKKSLTALFFPENSGLGACIIGLSDDDAPRLRYCRLDNMIRTPTTVLRSGIRSKNAPCCFELQDVGRCRIVQRVETRGAFLTPFPAMDDLCPRVAASRVRTIIFIPIDKWQQERAESIRLFVLGVFER